MSRIFSLTLAKQTAEALLDEEGITELPVDPIAIAESRGIAVEGNPSDQGGVSGMLLRHGNEFGIIYATHIPSVGFQRFSISHELGHYFLPGHVDQVLKNGPHASHAGFSTNDPYELEADHFAAGLLMPERAFRKAMNRFEPGLDAIRSLAELCQTSLTATAIRFAELTDMAVAVIVSERQAIDYCFLSEPMKSIPNLTWLRKGSPLPAGTMTARLAETHEAVLAGQSTIGEIDIRDWLGGQSAAIVTEECVGLGQYGKILTVLVSQSIGQEPDPQNDDETDEEVLERWTPRFKR